MPGWLRSESVAGFGRNRWLASSESAGGCRYEPGARRWRAENIVFGGRNILERRESVLDDSPMPAPLDPASLPDNVIALRTLLLHREGEHAAELAAAHDGLKEQVLRNEQLKLRLA